MAIATLAKVFPEAKLVQILNDFWDTQTSSNEEIADDVFSLGSEMDSLTAVLVILVVTGVLPDVPLQETVIKKGGYKTKEEFVAHMNAGIKKEAQQHGY